MSFVGRQLVIRKDGVPIAGARTKSVRFNNEAINVSHEEEDGFRHLLEEYDTRELLIGIEGVLSGPHAEQLIRPKIDGELVDVEVEFFDDESTLSADGAYISALQITGEYRNAVMFSASLVISGDFSTGGTSSGPEPSEPSEPDPVEPSEPDPEPSEEPSSEPPPPPPDPPEVADVGLHGNTTIASSHNIDIPGTAIPGDLVLAIVRHGAQAATISGPSGWTRLSGIGSGESTQVFARVLDGSEGSSITVGFSTARRCAAVMLVIRDHDGLNKLMALLNAGDLDPPQITASWAGGTNLFLAGHSGSYGDQTIGVPTNYTQIADARSDTAASDTNATVVIAERELAAATEDPGTFSSTRNNRHNAFTIVVGN